ncbi:MAG: hypothetical protein Q8Q35_00975 [Nanoarchaeota archaeon]|nr:hypothetical protein [Nanoarchaeota archaeon]
MKDLEQLTEDMGSCSSIVRLYSLSEIDDRSVSIIVKTTESVKRFISYVGLDLVDGINALGLDNVYARWNPYGEIYNEYDNTNYFGLEPIDSKTIKITSKNINIGSYTSAEVLQAYARNLNKY